MAELHSYSCTFCGIGAKVVFLNLALSNDTEIVGQYASFPLGLSIWCYGESDLIKSCAVSVVLNVM